MEDAEAAYAFAAARYPPERIALWGESLGSGVAVALAAEKPVGWVVLEAGFRSAADVGAGVYWYVPVRLLMKDQFRSDLRIGKVTAPVLMLHGDRDNIIPIALGERLYALINAPKRFVRFPAADTRTSASTERSRQRGSFWRRNNDADARGDGASPFPANARRYLAARRPTARLAAGRVAARFFADRRHSSLLASRAPPPALRASPT